MKITLLASLFLITLGFQNCIIDNGSFDTGNKATGNGGGYEGKLSGSYYQVLPGYTCEGQPAPLSEIKFELNKSPKVIVNLPDKCGTEGVFEGKALDVPNYAEYVVGFRYGIYKKRSIAPANSSATNVRYGAWCKSRIDLSNKGVDIIVSHDANQGDNGITTAMTILNKLNMFTGRVSSQVQAPIEVQRIFNKSASTVEYTANNDSGVAFKLTIPLTNKILANRQYENAVLTINNADESYTRDDLECRISLDLYLILKEESTN